MLDPHPRGSDARPAPDRGQGGLPDASVLKCEQITTVAKADVHGALGGPLPEAILGQVERAVLRAIGVPVGSRATDG